VVPRGFEESTFMASTLREPIVPPTVSCPFARAAIEKAPATTYDPFDATFLNDPYAIFSQLRVEAPVAYAPAIDMWTVTDFEDVDAIFKDPETFSAAIAQSPLDPIAPEAQKILSEGFRPLPVMSNLDPPEHARIKWHTSRAFSARRISFMENVIRERATALVDALPASGEIDLVPTLAFPLPAVTIFKMIGFPDEDMEMLKSWCGNRLVMTWGRTTPEDQQRIARQMVSYFTYCEEFVAMRATNPADDLTSDLLATGLEDGTLSHDEIVSIIYGLSFAGHENITNMIANTVRRLLENPATWNALVADTARLLPNTIEEALRFDSSNLAWRRVTTRPVTLRGVEIPKGARILVLLGAANHDPKKFANPETFDIERADARTHLAFGKGIHYCLGAALTRLELGIVLELLTARYPNMTLGSKRDYSYTPNVVFRGPTSLHVVLA
jgi:cytochrome P450